MCACNVVRSVREYERGRAGIHGTCCACTSTLYGAGQYYIKFDWLNGQYCVLLHIT